VGGRPLQKRRCVALFIGAALAGFLTRWLYHAELVAVDPVVVEEQRRA